MFTGLSIVGTWLLLIVIHAIYYPLKQQIQHLKSESLSFKKLYEMHLSRYNKEVEKVQQLRQEELFLKHEIRELQKINRQSTFDTYRIQHHSIQIQEITTESIIEPQITRNMSVIEESKFIEHVKLELVKKTAYELHKKGMITFEEDVNLNAFDPYQRMVGAKVIKAHLKVGVQVN
jgi:hypothetical protein